MNNITFKPNTIFIFLNHPQINDSKVYLKHKSHIKVTQAQKTTRLIIYTMHSIIYTGVTKNVGCIYLCRLSHYRYSRRVEILFPQRAHAFLDRGGYSLGLGYLYIYVHNRDMYPQELVLCPQL